MEFADELDNLGVRVANLEKKADNVKITGHGTCTINRGGRTVFQNLERLDII